MGISQSFDQGVTVSLKGRMDNAVPERDNREHFANQMRCFFAYPETLFDVVAILCRISIDIDVYLQENSQSVSMDDTDCDEKGVIDCG